MREGVVETELSYTSGCLPELLDIINIGLTYSFFIIDDGDKQHLHGEYYSADAKERLFFENGLFMSGTRQVERDIFKYVRIEYYFGRAAYIFVDYYKCPPRPTRMDAWKWLKDCMHYGKFHNENGPARMDYKVIWLNLKEVLKDSIGSYFLNGDYFTKQEYEEQMATKLYW